MIFVLKTRMQSFLFDFMNRVEVVISERLELESEELRRTPRPLLKIILFFIFVKKCLFPPQLHITLAFHLEDLPAHKPMIFFS